MRLWQRASGAFKDHSSLWQASLSRRTALRNPEIDKAVIRSTNHYDLSFDRRNVDRVCEWVRISPYNLAPVLRAVAHRMDRTRNWVVALKALYLMHNVLNMRLPCVKAIGRLPFDLSNFKDGHADQAKSWPFNAFVRAYYAFLDQKSALLFQQVQQEKGNGEGLLIKRELMMLQKLQSLVDLLMQIKPQSRAAFVPMILDVMDGVLIEIYDIYSRICRGIAIVLMNIYSGGVAEAKLALNVVQKATQQGEDLSYYFEFCQQLGIFYASELPVVDRIPEEGILELEQIIKDLSTVDDVVKGDEDEEKAIVVVEADKSTDNVLRTIITDKWEKFDEEFVAKNPFGSPFTDPGRGSQHQELPDLIIL